MKLHSNAFAFLAALSASYGVALPALGDVSVLDDQFFKDAFNITKQSDVPAFAIKYGFIQEEDADRREFFQNEQAEATIQILSPGDGYYMSIDHGKYNKACDKAEEIATVYLQPYETVIDDPYWDNQVKRISGWRAIHTSNHISIFCGQYDEDGYSDIGISIEPRS